MKKFIFVFISAKAMILAGELQFKKLFAEKMPEKIAKQKGSPNFQPLLKIFFCTPYGNQNVCGMEQC